MDELLGIPDEAGLTVSPPEDHAAGVTAVTVAMRRALHEMGPVRTARTLLRLNQTDGFDCMSCAWPDPEHRHTAEFCENGAKAVAEEATKARVGGGLEPDVQLGPIQNLEQYEKVVGILNDTMARGGRILAGGRVPDGPGYFFPPTIVADIDEHSRLVQEEQFGPILPVLKFADEEDALRRANDTRFGLSGSVWSADPERAARLAARLEVGTAWVNQHRVTSATVPFGGAKESGLGRQYAALGLKGYMEPRVISVLKG